MGKAEIVGRANDGQYIPVAISAEGGVVNAIHELEVARGSLTGIAHIFQFGRNTDIDTTTDPEDVWDGGGAYTGHPTGSPEQIRLTSTSANDDLTGTGMRTMRIEGLKTSTSTAIETEDIDLDGTNPVTSSSSWYRIFKAYGTDYGSGATNAGDITVQHNVTTANIFSVVQTGAGHSQVCAFSIPTGKTGYLFHTNIRAARDSGGAVSGTFAVRVREDGVGAFHALRLYEFSTGGDVKGPPSFPLVLPAKSDIKIATEVVTANDVLVTAEIGIILVDD